MKGNPSPNVTWWKNGQLLDYFYFVDADGSVKNNLTITLTRKDLMTSLTCKATNSNQTKSVTKKVLIDLNCKLCLYNLLIALDLKIGFLVKPTQVKIIKPSNQLHIKSKVEFVCQTSGSKPAATIVWKKANTSLTMSRENISESSLVTTSYISLILKQEDHLNQLSCISSNPKISNFTLSDSIKINLVCMFIFTSICLMF